MIQNNNKNTIKILRTVCSIVYVVWIDADECGFGALSASDAVSIDDARRGFGAVCALDVVFIMMLRVLLVCFALWMLF